MKALVFLLEGDSEKTFLKIFLPRAFPILKNREEFAEPVFIAFNGKSDLQKRLIFKLRDWNQPNSIFIVVQDQDHEDCHQAKQRLLSLCNAAGKQTNSIVRIACREIENWYLGDLDAIADVYDPNIAKQRNKSRFQNIDNIAGKHELIKLTNNAYRSTDDSRRIAMKMSTDYKNNKSHSFRVFCDGVKQFL